MDLLIVNGPDTKALGFNAGPGIFGNGYRSNGSLGRAFRLVCWNLGGARPGRGDSSLLSHPGEWGYCIAEDEERSPWEPLHVERGLEIGETAVTVFACDAPRHIGAYGAPKTLLPRIAASMNGRGDNTSEHRYGNGQCLLVLNPGQAQTLADEGWSKKDVKQYLWTHTTVKAKERFPFVPTYAKIDGVQKGIMGTERYPLRVPAEDPEADLPLTTTPDDIILIVGGGGGTETYAAYCPGWGPFGGNASTAKVTP